MGEAVAAKRHVTLSLTGEVVDELKKLGVNISQETDVHLTKLLEQMRSAKGTSKPTPTPSHPPVVEKAKIVEIPSPELPSSKEKARLLDGYRHYKRTQEAKGFKLTAQWYATAAAALNMSVEDLKKELGE